MISLGRRFFCFGAAAAVVMPAKKSIYIMPKAELSWVYDDVKEEYATIVEYDAGQMGYFLTQQILNLKTRAIPLNREWELLREKEKDNDVDR